MEPELAPITTLIKRNNSTCDFIAIVYWVAVQLILRCPMPCEHTHAQHHEDRNFGLSSHSFMNIYAARTRAQLTNVAILMK